LFLVLLKIDATAWLSAVCSYYWWVVEMRDGMSDEWNEERRDEEGRGKVRRGETRNEEKG
jgi:hypothetical protein